MKVLNFFLIALCVIGGLMVCHVIGCMYFQHHIPATKSESEEFVWGVGLLAISSGILSLLSRNYRVHKIFSWILVIDGILLILCGFFSF